jgi:hypothetical protein
MGDLFVKEKRIAESRTKIDCQSPPRFFVLPIPAGDNGNPNLRQKMTRVRVAFGIYGRVSANRVRVTGNGCAPATEGE